MTVRSEIERRLKELSPDKYWEFRRQLGGGPDQIVWGAAKQSEDIKAVLLEYDTKPDIRPKLCDLLNLPRLE